jgi:hypothetical protein
MLWQLQWYAPNDHSHPHHFTYMQHLFHIASVDVVLLLWPARVWHFDLGMGNHNLWIDWYWGHNTSLSNLVWESAARVVLYCWLLLRIPRLYMPSTFTILTHNIATMRALTLSSIPHKVLRTGLEGTTVESRVSAVGSPTPRGGWTWLQLIRICTLCLPSVQFQDGGR